MYGDARALCFALFEILTSSFKQFLRVPAPRHVSPFLRLFLRCPALASRFSSRADAQLLPASHRLRASSCLPVKSFSLFFFSGISKDSLPVKKERRAGQDDIWWKKATKILGEGKSGGTRREKFPSFCHCRWRTKGRHEQLRSARKQIGECLCPRPGDRLSTIVPMESSASKSS